MAITHSTTPRYDGFRMPAEFEPHHGTWMLFPERPDVWRENAEPSQRTFVKVATAIAQFEPVTVGAKESVFAKARQLLPPHIQVVPLNYDDAWVRDSGPSFVLNLSGEVRGVDWTFNAWGGLYPNFQNDDLVAAKILEMTNTGRYRTNLVTEGGALHVDGEGTLLAVKECIINPNRNPHVNQTHIERMLMEYLGVHKIIWLDLGVYNDETGGHIDNLACFVRPGVVALTWTDDASDPQYERSHAAYETLMSATDAQGRTLEVHKIHQPTPLYLTEAEAATIQPQAGVHPRQAGERLAASYVNFYIANGGVVVPTFNDPRDQEALSSLATLFPEHQVVGVYSREIIVGGGNIHCITQQQPAPQTR